MAKNNGLSWWRRQSAPITIILIASIIASALFFWTSPAALRTVALEPGWQQRPWTLFTYPWADAPFDGLSVLFFVFLCIWMYMAGGSVERDLGPVKYIGLWLVMILLPAAFIVTLGPLVTEAYGTRGMLLPEAAVAIIWCLRNPDLTLQFNFVIPVQAKWLALILAGLTVYLAGIGKPIFGAIASLHLLLAWAYAANKIPFWKYSRGAAPSFGRGRHTNPENLKKSEKMDKAYYDDVKKREKEREERERLRKLFESSIDDKKD